MKYKNIVLMPINYRSLTELSYELTTNHKHKNNELRVYGNTNERKYKKKEYPNDDSKIKQKISQVIEKETTTTTNSKNYRKGKYNKENKSQQNISSRSFKYLQMQRTLYNNFYLKPEIHFHNFSDKTNDKNNISCEFAHNKKSYNQIPSSNKVHDNYLYYTKKCCVGGAGACAISSARTGIAAVVATVTVDTVKGVVSTAPYVCGISSLVLILITVIHIVLYIGLHSRRKNSWKHEWKKHLCT